jgi:hypothetical protein
MMGTGCSPIQMYEIWLEMLVLDSLVTLQRPPLGVEQALSTNFVDKKVCEI